MTAVVISAGLTLFGGAENQLAAATKSVWKTFGATPVLKDVSIAIPFKDTRGLVGRTGAGKSTLVGILTGMLAPSSGSVELGGEPAPRSRTGPRGGSASPASTSAGPCSPSLSIAENLFLNNQPLGRSGAIDWRAMRSPATVRT